MLTHPEFCRRLRELREERGFSQASFERAFGCGRNRCRRWEDGKKYPTPETVRRIATVLNVPYSELELPALSKSSTDAFQDYLRKLRQSVRMESSKLSKRLGYDHECWSDWERGKHKPMRSAVEVIAHFFGLDADELLALRDGR